METTNDISKKQLEAFINMMPDAVIIANKKGCITSINEQARQLFGYKEEELLGQSIEKLIPQKHVDTFVALKRNYLKNPITTRSMNNCVGLYAQHKDGNQFPVDIMLKPFQYNNETYMMSVVRDISPIIENKEVREQLANIKQQLIDSEVFFHTLTEKSSDIIAIIDANGILKYASPSVKTLMDYTPQEVVGKSMFDFLPKEMKEGVFSIFQKEIQPNAVKRIEFKAQHKNNSWRIFELTATNLLAHPVIQGFLINAKDITQKKNIKKKLLFADEVLHHMGTLVVVTNNEGNVIYCAPSIKRILGFAPREMLGDGWWDLTFKTKKERTDMKKTVASFSHEAIVPSHFLEREITTKDGKKKWIMWHHQKGLHDTVIAVGYDITRRKVIEEELKIRNRELNTFVYKTSHDLRSPLASILGLVNLAQISITDKDSLDFFDMIQTTALRADKLITNLLELSTTLQGVIHKEKVEVTSVLNEIIDSIQHTKQGQGTSIKVEGGLSNLFYSDSRLLSSIFQNLIENAIKYNDKTTGRHINIKISEKNKHACFVFTDNGNGIHEEMQKKVFGMFVRGDTRSKGSGLGLYLIKTNVEKLGGRIKMKSIVGEGTIFSIVLPMSIEEVKGKST